ncbi:MAG: metallophosphoesterase family protein [Anaerolineae bacterium]|nr:metallophosphoesterase family protein [Anaerolineae bacterium]
MTRLAILADIHGNLPALEAVLADLAQFKVDQVVVAGDVINWGPFSPQVMQRVISEGWAVLRGNNELYLLDYETPRAPSHWRFYTMPPFLHRQLSDRQVAMLAIWPDSLTLRFRDAPTVRVVHGTPRSHFEPIYPISTDVEIATMLAGVEETTFVCGHTHLPLDRQVGRWHVLNPGTVGVPLDGSPEARYMLLDGDERGWRATFRQVRYDNSPLFAEFERLHFVEAVGVIGQLVIEEFRTSRLEVHPFIYWHKDTYPDQPQTFAQLEQYASVDKWAYTPPAYHINR